MMMQREEGPVVDICAMCINVVIQEKKRMVSDLQHCPGVT